ncbi:MAG TPA: nucleotide disphospho-sugar-binding domain-containing protein [Streptosporangiaceae bacterium]
MTGLVWAFRAAGHEVRVAAQPDLLDAVLETGAVAVSVGGKYDMMSGVADLIKIRNELAEQYDLSRPDGCPPDVQQKLRELRMMPLIEAAEDMAEDLATFSRKWSPDLVISDPLIYAAPLAAEAAGAPLVRHLWGPDNCRFLGMPGTGLTCEDDPRACWPERMVRLYELYGVKPQADMATRTLDACPASMQVAGVPNRIPVRYTPYNGAVTMPPWVLDPPERTRICVTWGSASTVLRGAEAFGVPRVLQALTGLGLDVIIAIRAADHARLGPLPSGMRVVEDMPLDLILPTCRAVIHQSGGGTMFAAAYYGVPQVTIPQGIDQELVCDRLFLTGASIPLKGEQADVDGIRAAALTILSTDGPAAAAERLREEILAMPAPAEIVAPLEKLADQR